jgi:hypothetical protein
MTARPSPAKLRHFKNLSDLRNVRLWTVYCILYSAVPSPPPPPFTLFTLLLKPSENILGLQELSGQQQPNSAFTILVFAFQACGSFSASNSHHGPAERVYTHPGLQRVFTCGRDGTIR